MSVALGSTVAQNSSRSERCVLSTLPLRRGDRGGTGRNLIAYSIGRSWTDSGKNLSLGSVCMRWIGNSISSTTLSKKDRVHFAFRLG
jgi:hypothetical protein